MEAEPRWRGQGEAPSGAQGARSGVRRRAPSPPAVQGGGAERGGGAFRARGAAFASARSADRRISSSSARRAGLTYTAGAGAGAGSGAAAGGSAFSCVFWEGGGWPSAEGDGNGG